MLSFFEYLAQSRKMVLPDTHTMMTMAGVCLDTPDEEETERLLNRARKRPVPLRPRGNTGSVPRAPGGQVGLNGGPGLTRSDV